MSQSTGCASLFVAATALAFASASCHPDRRPPMHPENPPGAWYVVDKGETLAQIASRVGVPAEDILELNGLSSAGEVTPGRLIYVLEGRSSAISVRAVGPDDDLAPGPGPGAGQAFGPSVPAQKPRRGFVAASSSPASSSSSSRPLPPLSLGRSWSGGATFRWPLDRTNIASPFGTRAGRLHEGIDLPAPMGTPVYAAADGEVVYAGDAIRGYGNLLVLQHQGDLLTVYAHNSELLVRAGDQVTGGQRIALVGQSGRATGPHLHFEVRSGQIPKNPMAFLPSPNLPSPNPPHSHSEPGGAP